MACGYAKATGRTGVCLATSGPGAIHLMNGLYDAKLDHQPVLAITESHETRLLGTGFEQVLCLDQVLGDVADYNVRVHVPVQIPAVVDIGIGHAMARGTVSHITLPWNLEPAAEPGPWMAVTAFAPTPCWWSAPTSPTRPTPRGGGTTAGPGRPHRAGAGPRRHPQVERDAAGRRRGRDPPGAPAPAGAQAGPRLPGAGAGVHDRLARAPGGRRAAQPPPDPAAVPGQDDRPPGGRRRRAVLGLRRRRPASRCGPTPAGRSAWAWSTPTSWSARCAAPWTIAAPPWSTCSSTRQSGRSPAGRSAAG
jgi:Thiamine pyrophosphate enzyme, N-terminal TPP binding domain